MSFRLATAATLLTLLALLLPAPSRAATGDRPQVDLRHITFTDTLASAPRIDGQGSAELTLDLDLQRTAERLLARAHPVAGAVLLADARTGRLLIFAERTQSRQRAGHVLLDTRAPAASLFKLVTAATLLERSPVSPRTRVCTVGGERRIDRSHLDAPPRDAGAQCTRFGDSIGFSRNAVFAQLATQHLLRSDLIEVAERLGFNRQLPFAADVAFGTLKVPVNDLDFARAAAGFRDSRLSPLGALELAFTVASGGQAIEPLIVARAGDYRAPDSRLELGRRIERRTALRLTRMMEVTVHSGTSLEAFTAPGGGSYLRGLRVAGKTGTLQPSPRAPTTTWFIGFAPSRNPRVVVSVLLQNGPVWRQKANEVARDALRAYFAKHGQRGVTDPLANPNG